MKSRKVEIEFVDIDTNEEYALIVEKAIDTCFEVEDIKNNKLYVEVILTTNENIKDINKRERKIDEVTDVLSFPMYETYELEEVKNKNDDMESILGDVVISIPKIIKQSKEFDHTIERELSYMVIHSFYHLLGFDHMEEVEKKEMRKKEKIIMKILF